MTFQKKSATPKPTPFVLELAQLAERFKAIPYENLASAYQAEGIATRLLELSVQPTYSGTNLVTFTLQVGRGLENLEHFDQLTVAIAPGPGPISAAARMAARETVIFLVSGRLPPPREPQAADAPAAMNGAAERVVPMADQDVVLDRAVPDEQEYVEPASDLPAVNVVERREPDGLPIFRDLYEIGVPEVKNTGEIIEAVLDEITSFLAGAVSVEQVDALAVKNDVMMQFIKDLGTKADIEELKGLVNKRRNELQRPPGAVPRRRTAAAPRAN